MTAPNYFNDSPISEPDEDRFGIDPFAKALARSLSEMKSTVGAAIALNGPWGSGKSSAINLIRHHVRNSVSEESLAIIDFKCWWFRGEEALTLAFLRSLNDALGKSIGEKARDLIPKLGKQLLQAGPVVGPIVNLSTGGVWGALTSAGMDFTKRFFPEGESIESVFDRLSEALEKQDRRFLVIIDDIDRLSPEEALLVFRLVKSVGRLPKVMYLLVFDRVLAERAVEQRYPSEGPHFLEKIVQASFELPLPIQDDLNSAFLAEVERCCGSPKGKEDILRFMNIFYDVVVPYLNSPRDLTRLTNSMVVSWPPVAGEVDIGDFVALEILKTYEAKLYNLIRMSKERLCGAGESNRGGGKDKKEEIDQFLEAVPEQRREVAKTALMRLFPRLEEVGYSGSFEEQWNAKRLLCSDKHFDTYFRMSVGDETLPIGEIEDFIKKCGNVEYVKDTFKQALGSVRRNGRSKVPILFDEINSHADKIEKEKFQPLVTALFEIADEIDREGDQERGFSFGDNQLRIHWLIRRLMLGRCTLEERSAIFDAACKNAGLKWLTDFVTSAYEDYHPREGEEAARPEKCLTTEEVAEKLRTHALARIQTATDDGSLISHPRLAYILYRWKELAKDDGKLVRNWTESQLGNDIAIAHFAKAFTSESWSQGMGMFGLGDRVAMRNTRAQVAGLSTIIDDSAFRQRVEALAEAASLPEPHKENVNTFLAAWRQRDKGGHD